MNNVELIEPYFESIGYHFVSGEQGSIEPIAIFVLQDYIYQVFERDIKHIELRHEAKKMRSDWHKANVKQFKVFFSRLDNERSDAIIALMDDFATTLHNEIEMMRLKILDCLPVADYNVQKVLASLQLCNILSQISQMHWVGITKKMSRQILSTKLPCCDAVRKYSCMLSSGLFAGAGGKEIDHKSEDELIALIQNFENKFIRWIEDKSDYAKS